MTPAENLKREAPHIIAKYTDKSDSKGMTQILNTLLPFGLLFYLALRSTSVSYWLTAVLIVLLVLFNLRLFVLMHDCGHNSLFRSPSLNRFFGFVLGVVCAMPQYVWSQHHNYHHATNGNWDKYRGPLSTLSVDEFFRLSPFKQKLYTYTRHICFAPIGAFFYFVFFPRFNWAVGSLKLLSHVFKTKRSHPQQSITAIAAGYASPYWKNAKEYRHMLGNNVILLSIWILLSWQFGAAVFFTIYFIVIAFAGAVAIVLFTVQHNFESSYAGSNTDWCYYRAVLEGTSFLVLPGILNWFTANIGFHHIHHLSARIPNYRLPACHREFAHLFTSVTRLQLKDVIGACKCILWDTSAQKIISIDRQQSVVAEKAG